MFERQEQYLTSDKSGILGVFYFSSFAVLFFSHTPCSSIVLLLFVVMGVRKDRISVILAFLQGLMSVRSGKLSVREQRKN